MSTITFHSILFERAEDSDDSQMLEEPAFFADLNLNQVVEAITIGKQEYNLKPFYHRPLKDIDTIKYRHEVMQDLEDRAVFEKIKSFAQRMRAMREHLAQADKLYYKYQRKDGSSMQLKSAATP